MEIKEIDGFPGYYISDTADVYSTMRGGFKKLKQQSDRRGYLVIGLQADGNRITKKVHRLVAEAFIANPQNKPFINHKNGIRYDNRLENLEWVTHRENVDHAVEHGLLKSGENHTSAKRTEEDVRKVCKLLQDGVTSCNQLSELTGVPYYICSQIKRHEIWTAVSSEYHIPETPKRNPKLSDSEVRSICEMLNGGLRPYEIVRVTQYSFDTIANIRSGKSYRSVSKKYLHKTPTAIESTSKDGSE